MSQRLFLIALCTTLISLPVLQAQQPETQQQETQQPATAQPEFPQPQEQHQWLKRFAGEWVTQSEGSMGPDQPPMQCEGTMSSRMLGGFWVINEMQGDVMGAPMAGLQTIGYDPEKKKYVGTWVDSMTNLLWQYEGTVDESGKKLSLIAEGPNFMAAGKTTQFEDAYEFKTPDHIIVTSSIMDEDGKWIVFMKGDMRRKE